MTAITIRNPSFDFPAVPELEVFAGNPDASANVHGLSMTMPHLEPYLIRTMRAAAREVRDEELGADLRAFSGQEGNHYRNHIAMNDAIKAAVGPESAARLTAIEDEMEADYQRFSREETLKFNTAYAEGFEAMTFAIARASFSTRDFDAMAPWARDIWTWHLAEETEHRTVAFEVFEHLYGGYFHRVFMGFRAQGHFTSYWDRFSDEICRAMTGRKINALKRGLHPMVAAKAYLQTLSPFYHPRKCPMPKELTDYLAGMD